MFRPLWHKFNNPAILGLTQHFYSRIIGGSISSLQLIITKYRYWRCFNKIQLCFTLLLNVDKVSVKSHFSHDGYNILILCLDHRNPPLKMIFSASFHCLFPLVRFWYKSACDTRADDSNILGGLVDQVVMMMMVVVMVLVVLVVIVEMVVVAV